MKITAGTAARTICLALALINQLLTVFGKKVIPFADDDIYTLVSAVFTIGAATAAWWKNNSFTEAARTADELLKAEKQQRKADKKKEG